MTAKDVLLLLRHIDEKSYLGAEIFFGFSNSEFIKDNIITPKDKKKSDLGTLNILFWTINTELFQALRQTKRKR